MKRLLTTSVLLIISGTLMLGFGIGRSASHSPTPVAISQLSPTNTGFNSSFWVETRAGSGPSVATSSQLLQVQIPPNSANDPALKIFGAGLGTQCLVGGDFDVQVHFRLLNFSFANGVRVGLASLPGQFFTGDFGTSPPFAVERTSFGSITGDAPGVTREVYLTHFLDGVQGLIPTSDLTGSLRLTRIGGYATGYYMNAGNWIAVHTGPTTTQDVHLDLVAWSHDFAFTHTFVKVAFDNFTISQGSAACPSITLNPVSGSVGTKVQVQATGFPLSNFGPDQVLMSFDGNLIGFASNVNGSFSFSFDVPLAQPGIHQVKALDGINGNTIATPFFVTPVLTLTINLDVGTLYFPGETASIFTLATLTGTPLNSTNLQLQIIVTRPDGTNVSLATYSVGSGLFKATYIIPKAGPVGTYAIFAKAHTANAPDASSLATFEVKLPWLSSQAQTVLGGTVAVAGIGALGAVLWRTRVFRNKDN